MLFDRIQKNILVCAVLRHQGVLTISMSYKKVGRKLLTKYEIVRTTKCLQKEQQRIYFVFCQITKGKHY